MTLPPSRSGEEQVKAKAQRLSEWENMTDKQKTAVSELEKLKKALTMQVGRIGRGVVHLGINRVSCPPPYHVAPFLGEDAEKQFCQVVSVTIIEV